MATRDSYSDTSAYKSRIDHTDRGTVHWENKLGMADDNPIPQKDLLDKQAEGTEDASFDSDQIITIARDNLNMLAGLAMPTVFEYMFPPVLLAAWQLLCQLVERTHDFSKVALGIPRGHGKTTLIKLFILFVILFTKKQFILIISDTEQKAVNIIADVIDMLSEQNIIKLFGNWSLGVEMNTQQIKKFGFRGRNIIIVGIGAGGSLRGLNLKNARPDVMIFDDVQSKECSESQLQSDTLERWLVGTAMKAKSPKGCLYIYAGNMFPGNNCILKKFKTNPSWVKFISGAILANGQALWPELHPLDALKQEFDNDIAMGHPEIFLSEVMNDTEVGVNKRIDLSALKPWPFTDDDRPQGRFILIDPATGKIGKDLVAIGYCEVYDEKPGLVEIVEEPLSPGNTIRRALLLGLRNNCRCIIVESTAYQSTLLYWFGVISEQLGITGFQFLEVYGNQYSKNTRISDALKELAAGDILLHPSVRSHVTNQIVNWNPMKRDNVDGILDLLGYMTKCMELHGPLMTSDEYMNILDVNSASVVDDNLPF